MDDKRLEQLSHAVGTALAQRHATITTAESCTGGWIAKVLTDIAGSSAWFEQGFVTYSNQAKHEMIGVQDTTLQTHGAVSEAVVLEMASGAQQAAGAQFSVAVSGIAGPDGGSVEKPVGTVWFGFAAPGGERLALHCQFAGGRESVRRQAVQFALETLLEQFL